MNKKGYEYDKNGILYYNGKPVYYNLFKARTSNRPYILIVGGRGIGKSCSGKDCLISDFLTRGWQFIYVRRFGTELDISFDTYLDDAIKLHPGHEVKAKGGKIRTYWIDGLLAGYAFSINDFGYVKSITPDPIYNILFDEFIPENGLYIKHNGNASWEVDQCRGLYQTVSRGFGMPFKPGVRFYFMSNAVDFNNPYFKEFGISEHFNRLAPGTKSATFLLEDVYAELVDKDAYAATDIIKESKWYKGMKDSRYAKYAVDNEFYNDSKEFISGKLPSGAKHLYNILAGKDTYGVWIDNSSGLFYVSNKYDPACKINYALSNEAHKINTELIEKNKNVPSIKMLREAYNNGFVLFKNGDTKQVLLDFLGVK